MSIYEITKVVHIVLATVILGTGLGTAFMVWRANRSGEVSAIAFATRHAVVADWLFTTPAVIVQPVSGAVLVWQGGYDPLASWLVWSYGLYCLVGACWIPVVGIQIRSRDLARAAIESGMPLPPEYWRGMTTWISLGWPAFLAVLVIIYLMVAKP